MSELHDKTLALAGVFQAGALVHTLASHGTLDQAALATGVRCLLQLSPPDTETVFGGSGALRLGLQTLVAQLGDSPRQRNVQIARYVISLLQLQRNLVKQPDRLETIRQRLQRVQQQVELFGTTHDNVIAHLAAIYADVISPVRPRIIVLGNETHLTNHHNPAYIRTLLFAGIRAAVLWQQLGGSRWQILWKRGVFVQEAQKLLDNMTSLH